MQKMVVRKGLNEITVNKKYKVNRSPLMRVSGGKVFQAKALRQEWNWHDQ